MISKSQAIPIAEDRPGRHGGSTGYRLVFIGGLTRRGTWHSRALKTQVSSEMSLPLLLPTPAVELYAFSSQVHRLPNRQGIW